MTMFGVLLLVALFVDDGLAAEDGVLMLVVAVRGLRDEQLSTGSGIPGCVFVHMSGFDGLEVKLVVKQALWFGVVKAKSLVVVVVQEWSCFMART